MITKLTYGKSKEESSFLYDPLYTFRTTLGGQLFGCMWAEALVEASPTLKFIQANTDGITIYLKRTDLEAIRKANDKLTELTGLTIEETLYSMMAVRDVNNYISVYSDSTPEHEHLKLKGDYEVDKEFHKDPSMRIVPLAVKQFLIYDIPIEETIRNHKDIFDFCLQLKCNNNCTGIFKHLQNGRIVQDELQRMTRYYVSNSKESGIFIKRFDDGREVGVNVGFSVVPFNKYIDKSIEDYKLNYQFYIAEANKLKDAIIDRQLYLF